MNKRGVTFSSWTEAIVIGMIVFSVFFLMVGTMDTKYGKTNTADSGFNFSTSAMGDLQNFTTTSQTSIQQGKVSYTAVLGLSWEDSWSIIKSSVTLAWTFITGNWIPLIMTNIFFGFPGIIAIARVLQILFLIGLVYAAIRIIFGGTTP